MPKRTDIHKVLIIGAGPIIISQACEFDYSGSQACKALREEGLEVVLVNSNPATIMTDPELAHGTYIEPVTPEVVEKIIARERPDALLPTVGGQTALNCAVEVARRGVLERYGVRMIGANEESIRKAEERELFRAAMARAGIDLPRSGIARTLEEARSVLRGVGLPVIIRPGFTLGGTGSGVAYNTEEFEEVAARGLRLSMNTEILVEESLLGWKEFELEVMRDLKDNVVIICSIENFDPMGVHTGDSITVAPAQTLTDREYQEMRDASIACIREIGVETGGSNVQFAVCPDTGRQVIIEMNPRVSRSSALASKATGFPIAKIAAKLACGYTLDEIPNDITRQTPACFEPTIDYCVVKIPRFTFEKFPGAERKLTTSMKSVGETMAIGRNFREALQKGLRGLETGFDGFELPKSPNLDELRNRLIEPNDERLPYLKLAFQEGMSAEEIHELSRIDPWFLDNLKQIVEAEEELSGRKGEPLEAWTADDWRTCKSHGFSDRQLARLLDADELTIRDARKSKQVEPAYKLVDTCGAEFEAYTPYFYSTYETVNENRLSTNQKVIVLGGGPNRIGQGIEFDYCCVHASMALRDEGLESIMVNSNPETVSTDYDISDKLYFEPVTFEDVMNLYEQEQPLGVMVQFGGQTPLNIAVALERAGAKILGTPPDAIDRAEDRDRFREVLQKLGLRQPPNGTATSLEAAREIADRIGYPVLLRPSFVLGGRAMEIVYDAEQLEQYMARAVSVSSKRPVLVDRFLEDAIEVDTDAVADGEDVRIAGIMEHIEEAGIHSGDSACSLPPFSLSRALIEEIREATCAMALELGVVGLMNVQYAIQDDVLYVLEVNPRASRTVPFVSKATGIPWAKVAAKLMIGRRLKDLGLPPERELPHISVKEVVLPFNRFPEADPILSPEMRSTGEVMGLASSFPRAFAKAQMAAGGSLPQSGGVFLSVPDRLKPRAIQLGQHLTEMGFQLYATEGTQKALEEAGVSATRLPKVQEGRPNILDLMTDGKIDLVINTPVGKQPRRDQMRIISLAIRLSIPYITTIPAARAAVQAIRVMREGELDVRRLQEYHA
jgi:carbamoyl-phosphate synthase large subunit